MKQNLKIKPWHGHENYWVEKISSDTEIPLECLLVDSFYYPACGFDGFPVKFFHHLTTSFVYVDYGIKREDLFQSLTEKPFCGYKVFHSKTRSLIINNNLPIPNLGNNRYIFDNPPPPFMEHFIFQREDTHDPDHGPLFFSLLFICGEGVETYRALYNRTGIVPKLIGIIQPGTGFGGNWTDFRKADGPLAEVVLNHPKGCPDFLVHGRAKITEHHFNRPIWPEYRDFVSEVRYHRGELGPYKMALFKKNDT